MNKTYLSLLCLLFVGGCSLGTPASIQENEPALPREPVSHIAVPAATPVHIECLDQEEWSGADPAEKNYTLYFKKVNLPDYNISIRYMSPTSCDYDRENAHRVRNGNIDPQ